jgi:co-chaperonin GroES (HSP10)
MDVRPLHDLIIVQRLEDADPLAGAIVIPDSAKEKPQRGKVIAAGNGVDYVIMREDEVLAAFPGTGATLAKGSGLRAEG